MAVADWFRPKWKHSQASVRLAALKDVHDSEVLAHIAASDPDSGVRAAAALRIEEGLARRTKSTTWDAKERRDAAERVTDARLLGEIAQSALDPEVRKSAVERLDEHSCLVEIANCGEDGAVREVAISRIREQTDLAQVVKTAGYASARVAAAKRIVDQRLLYELALFKDPRALRDETLQYEIYKVSRAVVERISDQGLLRKLVETSSDAGVYSHAIERIADSAVLAEIARGKKGIDACLCALRRVTDDASLAEIAGMGHYPEVRKEAAKRITEERSWAAVARSPHSHEHAGALDRITDQRLLAEVAEKVWNDEVCQRAVERITDPHLLAGLLMRVAHGEARSRTYRKAVERITDQRVLAEVAATASDDDVRETAANRITDQAALREIAESDSLGGRVRFLAAERISDSDVSDRAVVRIGLANLGQKLGSELAQRLVAIAEKKPHLLRDHWDELVRVFAHNDANPPHDDRGGTYQLDCGRTHSDGPHTDEGGAHVDRGISWIRFPPKPTNF
jgi:hypothetical protein